MDTPRDFVHLPLELRLDIAEYLSDESLVAFAKTYKGAYEIAFPRIKKERERAEDRVRADLMFVWDYDKPLARPQGVLFTSWYVAVRYEHMEVAGVPKFRHLIKACEEGNTQRVQTLLDEGASPYPPEICTIFLLHSRRIPVGFRGSAHYYTPLQAATHFNRTSVLRALLAAGVKPTGDFESLVLLFCMGHPDQDTLDLLFKHGFYIQTKAPNGYVDANLLHCACRFGCSEVVIANLINNGISVRVRDRASESPLSIAMGRDSGYRHGSRRYYEVIRVLLSRASHKELRDSQGNYPLHLAVRNGDTELVRMLLHEYGADPNVGDPKGITPLWLALHSEPLKSDIIRLLLEADASLHVFRQNPWNSEKLWPPGKTWAIDIETVRMILDTGISQSILEHCPHPFVDLATSLGDVETLKSALILCKKDRCEKQQRYKRTVLSALSLAMGLKNETCIEVLLPFVLGFDDGVAHIPKFLDCYLQNGTDTTVPAWPAQDECASFDLSSWKDIVCAAIRHQSPEIVSLLLECSQASPNISLRLSLLKHAIEVGSIDCLAMLIEHPLFIEVFPADESIILHAAGKGHTDVLQFLYYQIGGPDDKSNPINFPRGPLIEMACKTGNVSNVRWLLESGVDVDIYEGLRPDARNPLINAVTNGNQEIVKLLLAYNADSNEREPLDGKTALHLAVYGGHVDITRLLLKAGANVDTHDNHGRRPLSAVINEVNHEVSQRTYGLWRPDNAVGTAEWLRRPLSAVINEANYEVSRQTYSLWRSDNAVVTAEWFRNFFEPRIYVMRALAEYGADLNKERFRSWTLFGGPMGQIWLRYIEKSAAALDAVDDQGRTSFLFTVEKRASEIDLVWEKGLRSLLYLFILAGCDTSKSDSWGKTPLHVANAEGDDELVKLLYAAR